MKRLPTIMILLAILMTIIGVPTPGYSLTEKIALHIEGMT
jgi:hypothetical protein